MRDAGALLPAVLLAVLLLLLASELATLSCGHRIPRADVAAWKHHAGAVAPPSTTSRATTAARTGDASSKALGEAKRLVPQGSNPLHN
ncbi:hypothetical protein GUJ93_ZPchr0004g40224 [Zizania palustris]|uniref:Uncharacterized protein n=1 Tax=Zizania palustris TaxID=103762 RepID=A0A8J5RZY5_ZIZPA|nr:hypothetical protein GUJ93_ZPchr0004g40224 [Zizania palustris]